MPFVAVADDLGQPADRGRDHGDAEGQRFHHGDRQALVVRREHEQVGGGDEPGGVVAVAEQAEPVAETARAVQRGDLVGELTLAGGDEPHRARRGRRPAARRR